MPSSAGISGSSGPQREMFAVPRRIDHIPRQKIVKKPVKKMRKSKETDVVVRSEFPETWIWTEESLEYVSSVPWALYQNEYRVAENSSCQ